MLKVNNIHVHYGTLAALRGVSIEIHPGEIVTIVGPNGAGKTTAVNILTTLIKPTAGSATVAGADVVNSPGKVRKRIGVSGQFAAVDENLTGFENLDMIGRLYRLGREAARVRARELLDRFDLTEAADRPGVVGFVGRGAGGRARDESEYEKGYETSRGRPRFLLRAHLRPKRDPEPSDE